MRRVVLLTLALMFLAPQAHAATGAAGAGVVGGVAITLSAQRATPAPSVGLATATVALPGGAVLMSARLVSVNEGGATVTFDGRCSRVRADANASLQVGFTDAVNCTLTVTDGGSPTTPDHVSFSYAPGQNVAYSVSGPVSAGDFVLF